MIGKVIKEAYTFDDLFLVPGKSNVVPANVKLATQLTKKIKLEIPILSAAMDTVTEANMAIALAKSGGLGIIHKNMSIEAQAKMIETIKKTPINKEDKNPALDQKGQLIVGAAIGINDSSLKRVTELVKVEVDIIVIDSAHGHSQGVIETIKKIRKQFPNLDIIGGNVVTALGAIDLIKAGVNVVKVGVGPGSICTTRVIAGVGVPQLTAINDVYNVAKEYEVTIIADGGIKFSGDIAKAIGAGASAVMLGGLLAGSDEAPGEIIEINNQKVKAYIGMGSLSAMKRGSSDRYFQGGLQELKKLVPEGIEGTVSYKGPIKNIVYQLLGGLRSGMGYCGCATILEMQQNAQFVKITKAGLKESHPHDVDNIKDAPNYNGK